MRLKLNEAQGIALLRNHGCSTRVVNPYAISVAFACNRLTIASGRLSEFFKFPVKRCREIQTDVVLTAKVRQSFPSQLKVALHHVNTR